MEQFWTNDIVTVNFGEKYGTATVKLCWGETERQQEYERHRTQLSRAIFFEDLGEKHQ